MFDWGWGSGGGGGGYTYQIFKICDGLFKVVRPNFIVHDYTGDLKLFDTIGKRH